MEKMTTEEFQKILNNAKSEKVEKKNGGIGICGILFLIFLILKLTDNITWSWWWVTSPLWIPFALVFIICIIIVLVKIIGEIVKKVRI